jgi:hypothetical protein
MSPKWVYPVHLVHLLCVLVVLLVYYQGSVSLSNSAPIMPVDDAYIHFQYAKQLALGQPYVYNPGLPPTSGATSFIYPYFLALGYLLGFQDLQLGIWAMLIGAIALFFSGIAIYRLFTSQSISPMIAGLISVSFSFNGAIAWHFMSGMETGLMITFTLWTLYAFITQRLGLWVFAAALLALTRPEGSIMTVIAAGLYAERLWRMRQRDQLKWVFLPITLVFVQPLLNFALTGSFSAAGNQSKSLLGMIPAYYDLILTRIWENFTRMWVEFLTGINQDGIWFLPPILLLFALYGLFRVRQNRLLLLCFLWFLALTTAIATLDTAFWHFKRYQMPLIALLWVFGGWGLPRRFALVIAIGLMGFTAISWSHFYEHYRTNVQNIIVQPLSMAQWLRENTSPDATIAVHDVGIMRYYGERTTIDMVGLTTANASDYWRNGPGAVGEFLIRQRPDYIAAYTTARGLNYLATSSVYGDLLIGFTAQYDPRFNVALGAEFQGVFRPTWNGVEAAHHIQQPSVHDYLTPFEMVDQLNVADLASEQAHQYRWFDRVRFDGFPTVFYQQSYLDCRLDDCIVTDGGRRINGEEHFTMRAKMGQDAILITRIHPEIRGTIDLYLGETYLTTRWIPQIPGQWLELATLIPADLVITEQLDFKIVANTPDGHYMPYYHWLYQGSYQPNSLDRVDAQFQEGALQLQVESLELNDDQLTLNLNWFQQGQATGDYILFVHVYADPAQPPIAQAQDQRLGNGTLPIGNLLEGVFSDQLVVDLSQVTSGHYQVALGLYDPVTFERLMPMETTDPEGRRWFIGEIEVR